jgi:predicted nucleotidyltransferase
MMDTAYQSSVNVKESHSYDECVALLAHAVRQHDEGQIDQVAELIGELAVVIEL